MKKSLLSLIILMAQTPVLAETYICQVHGTDQTITFGSVSELPTACETDEDGEFCWDRTSRFKLSLQTTELPFPDYVEYGTAFESDVYFRYISETSDMTFEMYLDENEPTEFTLNGKELVFSDCKYYNFGQ